MAPISGSPNISSISSNTTSYTSTEENKTKLINEKKSGKKNNEHLAKDNNNNPKHLRFGENDFLNNNFNFLQSKNPNSSFSHTKKSKSNPVASLSTNAIESLYLSPDQDPLTGLTTSLEESNLFLNLFFWRKPIVTIMTIVLLNLCAMLITFFDYNLITLICYVFFIQIFTSLLYVLLTTFYLNFHGSTPTLQELTQYEGPYYSKEDIHITVQWICVYLFAILDQAILIYRCVNITKSVTVMILFFLIAQIARFLPLPLTCAWIITFSFFLSLIKLKNEILWYKIILMLFGADELDEGSDGGSLALDESKRDELKGDGKRKRGEKSVKNGEKMNLLKKRLEKARIEGHLDNYIDEDDNYGGDSGSGTDFSDKGYTGRDKIGKQNTKNDAEKKQEAKMAEQIIKKDPYFANEKFITQETEKKRLFQSSPFIQLNAPNPQPQYRSPAPQTGAPFGERSRIGGSSHNNGINGNNNGDNGRINGAGSSSNHSGGIDGGYGSGNDHNSGDIPLMNPNVYANDNITVQMSNQSVNGVNGDGNLDKNNDSGDNFDKNIKDVGQNAQNSQNNSSDKEFDKDLNNSLPIPPTMKSQPKPRHKRNINALFQD
jgi:hypothetical protein